MSRFTCVYCKGSVVGSAYITAEGLVLHDGHVDLYDRQRRGLTHCCPECPTPTRGEPAMG